MTFAIIHFVNSDEIDFVPWSWIVDVDPMMDSSKLMKIRQVVEVYWPPMKTAAKVSRARDLVMAPEVDWPKYWARILGTAREFCCEYYCNYFSVPHYLVR